MRTIDNNGTLEWKGLRIEWSYECGGGDTEPEWGSSSWSAYVDDLGLMLTEFEAEELLALLPIEWINEDEDHVYYRAETPKAGDPIHSLGEAYLAMRYGEELEEIVRDHAETMAGGDA